MVRKAWVIGLFVGLAGCKVDALDVSAECLKQHPGSIRCCYRPGDLPTNGICCPPGYHAVSDVEHEDWKLCEPDEDPCADAGACLDAGADEEADAGAGPP